MPRRSFASWILTAAILIAGGCAVAPSDGTLPDDIKPEIVQFDIAYNEYLRAHAQIGPDKLWDLDGYFPRFPRLYREIEKGRFEVIWRAVMVRNTTENDKSILAYEKSAPESGGWVLRAGGTVQRMTADEFKEFPLAKTRPLPPVPTKK